MSVQEESRRSDPESWIWDWDGPLESVQDARDRTRGQAIARYCNDVGEWFPSVRAWKRHARGLTRADNWVWWVESRSDSGWEDQPDSPPDEWQPPCDEDMPAWEFCRPDDDGAIPVWIVAPKGVNPPPGRRA